MSIIFTILSLIILLLAVIIIGIILFKKIPDESGKQIVAKITYVIAVIGIIVGILVPLINSINDYIKDNTPDTIPETTDPPIIVESESSEIEPNDDFQNATLISCNNEISGTFANNEDTDYYYFSTDTKTSFNIELMHEFNDSDYKFCTVSIYSQSNIETPIYETDCGERNSKLTGAKLRIPAGTYYIKISPPSYGDIAISDYKFIVITSNEDDLFETEPNNTIGESKNNNLISLNSTITGNIQTEDDIDYYSFTVTNPGKLNISFSHDKIDDDNTLWKIELLSENQDNAIFTLDIKGSEANKKSDTIGISPRGEGDDYYLKIYPAYNYSNSDYKVCVNFSEFETNSEQNNGTYNYDKEPNNSTKNATPISINESIDGNIQSTSDIDYFKFEIRNDGELDIVFDHNFSDNNNEAWKISLLSESTTESLLEFKISINESSKTSDTIRIPPGIYYLKIEPTYNYRNDSYRVKINYNAS